MTLRAKPAGNKVRRKSPANAAMPSTLVLTPKNEPRALSRAFAQAASRGQNFRPGFRVSAVSAALAKRARRQHTRSTTTDRGTRIRTPIADPSSPSTARAVDLRPTGGDRASPDPRAHRPNRPPAGEVGDDAIVPPVPPAPLTPPAVLPLGSVPIADLGALWPAAVRAATAPTQRAVLDAADALRISRSDPDDSWRVLTAYRVLADAALEGPEAAARAAFMATEDPAHDAVTRRFAARASEAAGDAGILGTCAWARCVGDASHLGEALKRLLVLRARVAPRVDRVAFAVLHALTDVFLRQHREWEALLAARRADEVARATPDLTPVERALAAALLARAFVALGDAARLRAHVPRLVAAAADLPEPDATRARAHAHLLLARTAIDDDDLDGAAAALAVAEAEAARDVGVPGFGPAILRSLRLRLAVARRDGDAIERALAAIDEVAPPRAAVDVVALTARMLVAALRGRDEEAAARGRQALAALEDPPTAPATRVARAVALGRAARDTPALAGVAVQAWHVAADAALARLRELDGSVRDLDVLGPFGTDDLDAMAAHRARFVASHHQVLGPLRERWADAARRRALPRWATPRAITCSSCVRGASRCATSTAAGCRSGISCTGQGASP